MTLLFEDFSNLKNVHSQDACAVDQFCVVHRPSSHKMHPWPAFWRADKKQIERLCAHGIGHPDPDDLAYHVRNGREWMGIHGCDGCCK